MSSKVLFLISSCSHTALPCSALSLHSSKETFCKKRQKMGNQRCLKDWPTLTHLTFFNATPEAHTSHQCKETELHFPSPDIFLKTQKHSGYSQLYKCLLMFWFGLRFFVSLWVFFEGSREVKASENEQLSVFRDFCSTLEHQEGTNPEVDCWKFRSQAAELHSLSPETIN